MNKISMLIFLQTCLSITFGFAQTPEEIKTKMNEIKLNESYVCGEDFSDNKDIAFQNALTELTTFANELRAEKGKEAIHSSDLLTVVKELRYQKGNRHTILVYLPLSQMLGITSKPHADVISQNVPTQPGLPENQPEQQMEQEQKFTFVPNRQPEAAHSTPTQTPPPDDIMQSLCSQHNWIEIKGLLTTYKSERRISTVGSTLSYGEVPEDAYAILMDDMGGILSILSPKNSGNQINYRTNQTDNESNHCNCKFIVWYK